MKHLRRLFAVVAVAALVGIAPAAASVPHGTVTTGTAGRVRYAIWTDGKHRLKVSIGPNGTAIVLLHDSAGDHVVLLPTDDLREFLIVSGAVTY